MMSKFYKNSAKNLMQYAIDQQKQVLIVDPESDDDYELIVNEKGIRAGYDELSGIEGSYIRVVGEGAAFVEPSLDDDEVIYDYHDNEFFEQWWRQYEAQVS